MKPTAPSFSPISQNGLCFHPGLEEGSGVSWEPAAPRGKTASQAYADHSSACGGNTQLSCAWGTPPALSLLGVR